MSGRNKRVVAVSSGLLLTLALARLIWFEELGSRMDETFVLLLSLGVLLPLVPWERLTAFKAGGLELTLQRAEVQGAVAGLGLERVEEKQVQSALQELAPDIPQFEGGRILWIDDKPHKILGERRMLRALGAEVISVTSSDMAEEILNRDNDFDVIVSDVQRRGSSHMHTGGIEIHEGVNFIVRLRETHEDPILRSIPVIFYAAYDWKRLVEFTRPARETLPEPQICNSVPDLLEKAIDTVVRQRRAPIVVDTRKKPTTVD